MPVMGALVAAHARGIVHRDLKPANLFLSRARSGEMIPKVIDFGIAKDVAVSGGAQHRTQEGAAIGTPAYMSPEQVSGLRDIDARTDVWSLGVVLYEMLSGRLPFESPNVNVVMAKILYETPPPISTHVPGLPEDLCDIVRSALMRERSERFASVRAMLSATLEVRACPSHGSSAQYLFDDVAGRTPGPVQPPISLGPAIGSGGPSHHMATPHSTLAVPGFSGSQPTLAMHSPVSNPLSAAPTPGDTMLAVSRGVTSPTVPAGSRQKLLMPAFAVFAVLCLVAVVAAITGRGADRTETASTARSPSPGSLSRSPVGAESVFGEPIAQSLSASPALTPLPVPPSPASLTPPDPPRDVHQNQGTRRPAHSAPREAQRPHLHQGPRRSGPRGRQRLNADEM